MNSKNFSVSIVVPNYNGEKLIEKNLPRVLDAKNDSRNQIKEIIIVDDGSRDATGEIADRLAAKNTNIRVIHHPKNLGYGEALKSGFYNARYDTIVYTDGDGQFDFSEIHKFLEKIKNQGEIVIKKLLNNATKVLLNNLFAKK